MANCVYVASGVENLHVAQRVMHRLQVQGIKITYDWTKHGSVKNSHHQDQWIIAEEEAAGVDEASCLVALLPGGNGTHVEIGMAISERKKVFLYIPPEVDILDKDFCNFYNHSCILRYHDLDQMLKDVKSYLEET